MNKNYKDVGFFLGNTIEDAVNELLTYKERGELASGEFNGVKLYSDTVTMDSAYIEITGKTKTEFDKEQQKRQEDYDRRKKEHEGSIPELSKYWMDKARGIISEDKLEFWDQIVPIRLNDLYRGMELGACLEIVEILNNDRTLENAKIAIENQGHSGMSFGLVCSMVREFSDRGHEFVEFVN